MLKMFASTWFGISAIVMCVLSLCGCVTIPRDVSQLDNKPVFFNPLAARDDSSAIQLASLEDSGGNSLNESLWKLTRGSRISAWDEWGRENLQDGDIVFLQSTSNWIWGFIEFSQLTQDLTDSPFTHVALAANENGGIVLYAMDMPGPSRAAFGMIMANSKTSAVGVKRLRPEFQPFVPAALQYCRDVYASDMPFDKKLKLDNDRLYCAEMIEVAFRVSGLELSQPTRWQDLPGLEQHPYAVNAIAWANETQPSEFVVVPGNDEIGIWASPGLDLVLPFTDSKQPPEE